MTAIYTFVLKYVLDFIFGKVQTYFRTQSKKQESKNEIEIKVKRLNEAIKIAYDGEDITDEQSKEIISSARDLISSY